MAERRQIVRQPRQNFIPTEIEAGHHVDGRIDVGRLRDFVAAYQRRRPLTLGELWAIPIMMRQGLIENLRRVASRIVTSTVGRTVAREWSDQLVECADQTPHRLILLVAELAQLKTLYEAYEAAPEPQLIEAQRNRRISLYVIKP